MEMIRAAERDLGELFDLYRHAADGMEARGIRHWHWGRYPNEDLIREDVQKGQLYILRDGGRIAAAAGAACGQEEEYGALSWTCGVKPGSFHRIVVHPSLQGAGLGGRMLDEVLELLRRGGCDCVRCDTSENNLPALRFYEKHGFRRCGKLHWEGNEGDNITFDRALKQDAPLLPVRMKPAFRSGESTPWGGCRLHERYGKETGGGITGESLEASCIPGLESTDPLGRKLPDLIREFGAKMAGKYADRPFPMLLKLIDARDRLSVQVHPDDAYAASHEGGKLGKTEAWLILEAPEDSELVYGLRPGTGKAQLREACEEGSAVEALLRSVRAENVRFEARRDNPSYHPGRCADIYAGDLYLGVMGQIHPLVERNYDVDTELYCAELSLDALMAARGAEPEYTPLPRFPAVARDIAVVCREEVTVGALEDCIRRGARGLLKDVSLFDIYRGPGIAPGMKSVAFNLVLRSDERSLTAEDADADVAAILEALRDQLGAVRR